MPTNRAGLESFSSASRQPSRLFALLEELVELGREAWRISERERAVRAEIRVLQEIEDNA